MKANEKRKIGEDFRMVLGADVSGRIQVELLYFGDRLLLLDTDGNRFDFSDVRALDERSRALPDGIL